LEINPSSFCAADLLLAATSDFYEAAGFGRSGRAATSAAAF